MDCCFASPSTLERRFRIDRERIDERLGRIDKREQRWINYVKMCRSFTDGRKRSLKAKRLTASSLKSSPQLGTLNDTLTMNSKEKQWVRPVCVKSSVHVQPTQNFNQWQEELAEEQRFRRLINNFAADLVRAYTNRNV